MEQQPKILTPEEIEKELLEKQLPKDPDPLDAHAQLFYLYTPRFQQTLNFLSKKQMVNLMILLTGSEYNSDTEVNKLIKISDSINLNGLKRVIKNVVEHPLADDTFKLMSKKEQDLFHQFDELLINKYFRCIKEALQKDDTEIKAIEDVIKHNYNVNKLKARDKVEQDSFQIGNKVLVSKFFMMFVTSLEYLDQTQKDVREEGKENDGQKVD